MQKNGSPTHAVMDHSRQIIKRTLFVSSLWDCLHVKILHLLLGCLILTNSYLFAVIASQLLNIFKASRLKNCVILIKFL